MTMMVDLLAKFDVCGANSTIVVHLSHTKLELRDFATLDTSYYYYYECTITVGTWFSINER